MAAKTLYDKLWESHIVKQREDGTALIYIDKQLIHEVTSPQAFEGLRMAGRKPWRIDANLATPDHNVPTTSAERSKGLEGIQDSVSKIQVKTLDDNCQDFGLTEFKILKTYENQTSSLLHEVEAALRIYGHLMRRMLYVQHLSAKYL